MIIQNLVLYALELFGLALLEANHLKFNIDRGVLKQDRFVLLLKKRWSPLKLVLLEYEEYKALEGGWGQFGIRYSPIIIVAIAYIPALDATFRLLPADISVNIIGTLIMTLTLVESILFIRSTYK